MSGKYEDKVFTGSVKNMIPRLYGFMKPYIKQMLFATVLVIIIMLLDLYRPILIGDAIDNYIEAYNTPYYQLDHDCDSCALIGDAYYSKKEESSTYARLISYEDTYYLINNLNASQLEEVSEIEKDYLFTGDTETITYESYVGRAMSSEELKVLRASDISNLIRVGILYLAVLLVICVGNLVQTYVLQLSGQNIIYEIRMQLFRKLHFLPLRYFDTHPIGVMVTRVTNDVESIHEMYANMLIRLFKNSLKIIGLVVIMLSYSVKLALYAFVTIPIIAVLIFIFRILARKTYRLIRSKISMLNTFLSENITGMKLIQIFAKEEFKFNEFDEKSTDLYNTSLREMMIFAIFRPILYFLSQVAFVIVIYTCSVDILDGAVTIGMLYIFTNYIMNFFEPIQEIAEQFSSLQNAFASAEKIFTVLDEENPIIQKDDALVLENVKGDIEFKNVWFAYENDNYVLKDVSFHISPGQTVAFVGATGAGKSSILNLIGRYYDIQKGQILVDGHDIKDLNIHSLRRAIGQVQQDVFVFTGNMYSNIRLRKDSISNEDVEHAARFVNANYFIERLPHQYSEEVSERGATLSSGQRQLLSFARTIAYDPKILVMDEATANIDTETERLIQDGLESLMKGRTTIMVAHRLSTIQHADNIIVMHKGKIREMGTHQELLAQDGIYKKLYQLQLHSN